MCIDYAKVRGGFVCDLISLGLHQEVRKEKLNRTSVRMGSRPRERGRCQGPRQAQVVLPFVFPCPFHARGEEEVNLM